MSGLIDRVMNAYEEESNYRDRGRVVSVIAASGVEIGNSRFSGEFTTCARASQVLRFRFRPTALRKHSVYRLYASGDRVRYWPSRHEFYTPVKSISDGCVALAGVTRGVTLLAPPLFFGCPSRPEASEFAELERELVLEGVPCCVLARRGPSIRQMWLIDSSRLLIKRVIAAAHLSDGSPAQGLDWGAALSALADKRGAAISPAESDSMRRLMQAERTQDAVQYSQIDYHASYSR